MTTGKAIALTRQTLVSKVMSLLLNLTQMTIISTTVGKNPLEEIQLPSESTKESEMQYLDAMSKTTE